jgi:hypothetical protein
MKPCVLSSLLHPIKDLWGEDEANSFPPSSIPKSPRNTHVLLAVPRAASLPEGGQFVEGVPEERGLPLGLSQGKDLLLGDAGGHGDVALVQGWQVLVGWGHGASTVA